MYYTQIARRGLHAAHSLARHRGAHRVCKASPPQQETGGWLGRQFDARGACAVFWAGIVQRGAVSAGPLIHAAPQAAHAQPLSHLQAPASHEQPSAHEGQADAAAGHCGQEQDLGQWQPPSAQPHEPPAQLWHAHLLQPQLLNEMCS